MNRLHFIILIALQTGCLSAHAESRVSIGGQIGSASLSANFDGLDFDARDRSFRVFAGWHFNEYFSVEAGYQSFADFEQHFNGGVARIKADGFTFAARGALPLTERWSLYGKAGSFFWDGNARVNDITEASPSDANLLIGIGTSWQLMPSVQLKTEFTRFSMNPADINVVGAGVEYRF